MSNTEKMNFAEYAKIQEEKTSTLILDSLKSKQSPLMQSWSAKNLYSDLAINPTAQSIYRGLNVLMLDTTRATSDFNANQWLTFEQAKNLGASVKKGEKSTNVFFVSKGKSQDEINEILKTNKLDENEIKALKASTFRSYKVFNVEQVDFRDKEIPQYQPEFKPSNINYDIFQNIANKYAKQGESVESRILREQVALYILAKDTQSSYTINDTNAELLYKASFEMDSSTLTNILKEASKMSFEVLKQSNTQKIEKKPYIKKEKDEIKKLLDATKEQMRSDGKGFYSKETWQKLFDLEKNNKGLVDVEVRLEDFSRELNMYHYDRDKAIAFSKANKSIVTPQANQNVQVTNSSIQSGKEALEYFRANKKEYVPDDKVDKVDNVAKQDYTQKSYSTNYQPRRQTHR